MQATLLVLGGRDVDGRRLGPEAQRWMGDVGGLPSDPALSLLPGGRAPLGAVEGRFHGVRAASAAGPVMAFCQARRLPRQRRRDGVSPFARRRRSAGAKPVRVVRATLLRGDSAADPALNLRSAPAGPPGFAAARPPEGRGEKT